VGSYSYLPFVSKYKKTGERKELPSPVFQFRSAVFSCREGQNRVGKTQVGVNTQPLNFLYKENRSIFTLPSIIFCSLKDEF